MIFNDINSEVGVDFLLFIIMLCLEIKHVLLLASAGTISI